MFRRAIAVLLIACASATALANSPTLTPKQIEQLQTLLPGVQVTPQLANQMAEVFYNREMPVRDRVAAIGKLVGIDQMPDRTPLRRTVCIWDIAGRSGPVYQAAMEQRALALEYGIDIKLEPYTSEDVMVDEFQAGRCDAALMSGLRARTFNAYTGTIDAVGAMPTDEHMHTLLQVLAHPSQAGHMVQGNYVVMGIFPAGGAYVFVNDREISSLAKAAGRRVAVLDYDETQAEMVAAIGATPVRSSFVTAPNRFNNGQIDVLPAPLVAYEILELYRGMSPNGGIVDYPLAQLSMQLIGRIDSFPNEIAQLIREASLEAYPDIMLRLEQENRRVPDRWWIPIPEQDKLEYEAMMDEARQALLERDYYHADMLTLQRRIRCRMDASRAECSRDR